MLENVNGSKFSYRRLTEDEQKTRGILGRLVGPCADFINPTRNGRKYSEQLWENVFNDPIMKEKIAHRCCFGELGHPADRTEIDIEKVAICLAEQPKKGKDGKLYGVFDILNTPNGRILKQLCDYGCDIGISSRGQGDLITDMNGDEAVDPDTYDCECFDAVLVPGVETARLKYVTEDYHYKKKDLKAALTESLSKASESDRVIMEETLKELNININESNEEEAQPVEAKKYEDEEKTEIFTELPDFKVEVEQKGDKIEIELEPKEAEEEVEQPTEEEKVEETEIEVAPVEASFEEALNEEHTQLLSQQELKDEVKEDEKEIEVDSEEVDDEEFEDDEELEEPTEEEMFIDYLINNFDEDKVKEVSKILGIDEEELESTDDANEAESEDIDSDEEEADEDVESDEEALDEGLETVLNNLKEAIKVKSDLENTVKELQEKLAVSDAKVNEINEECNKYKGAVARLSKVAKSNTENTSKLEESLNEKEAIIKQQEVKISKLVESKKEALNEDLKVKDNEIKKLNEDFNNKLQVLTEQLNTEKAKAETEIKKLTENVTKQQTLKESYKNLANKAVNKYIEVKADILGLTTRDIKRKLGESYTMEDVDQVCEDLKAYNLNVSRLPFNIDRKVSVKVTESNAKRLNNSVQCNDDDVDDSLVRLANSYRD